MLTAIADGAHRLDRWLQGHIGRPYNVILTVGLVLELTRHLAEAPHLFEAKQGLVGLGLTLLLQAALLLHQVGEFSHRFKARGLDRGRRGANP